MDSSDPKTLKREDELADLSKVNVQKLTNEGQEEAHTLKEKFLGGISGISSKLNENLEHLKEKFTHNKDQMEEEPKESVPLSEKLKSELKGFTDKIADSIDDVKEKFTHTSTEAPTEGSLDTAPTHKIRRTEMTGFTEVKEGEGFSKQTIEEYNEEQVRKAHHGTTRLADNTNIFNNLETENVDV